MKNTVRRFFLSTLLSLFLVVQLIAPYSIVTAPALAQDNQATPSGETAQLQEERPATSEGEIILDQLPVQDEDQEEELSNSTESAQIPTEEPTEEPIPESEPPTEESTEQEEVIRPTEQAGDLEDQQSDNPAQIESTQDQAPDQTAATPDVPQMIGWNVEDTLADDFAAPRPDTELICGGSTSINSASNHWTDVSSGDPQVKYQRQFQRPDQLGTNNWSGNEIYSEPYSNFRTFGGSPGQEGTYNSRVRAFVDANNNNVFDNVEEVSDWSDPCSLTYDTTAPEMPVIVSITNQSGTVDMACSADQEDFTEGRTADDRRLTITWEVINEPDIAGYWYGIKDNPRFQWFDQPVDPSTTTSLSFTGLMNDNLSRNPFWYTVIAVDEAGNESTFTTIDDDTNKADLSYACGNVILGEDDSQPVDLCTDANPLWLDNVMNPEDGSADVVIGQAPAVGTQPGASGYYGLPENTDGLQAEFAEEIGIAPNTTVTIYEVTNGTNSTSWDGWSTEFADVYISDNGSDWEMIADNITNGDGREPGAAGDGVHGIVLTIPNSVSLTSFQYIRIVDANNQAGNDVGSNPDIRTMDIAGVSVGCGQDTDIGEIRIKKLICDESQFSVNPQDIRPQEDGSVNGVAFDDIDSDTYNGCVIAEDPYYFTLHYRTERGDELIGDINEYDQQYYIDRQGVVGEYSFGDLPTEGRYWVWEVDPVTGNRVQDEQVLAMACYSSPQENASNSLTNPMANAIIPESGEGHCIVFNEGQIEPDPEPAELFWVKVAQETLPGERGGNGMAGVATESGTWEATVYDNQTNQEVGTMGNHGSATNGSGSYTVGIDNGSFPPCDEAAPGEDCYERVLVPPGEYRLEETQQDGFELAYGRCNQLGGSYSGLDSFGNQMGELGFPIYPGGDADRDYAMVTVDEGDRVYCSFFNEPVDQPDTGTLSIKKLVCEDGEVVSNTSFRTSPASPVWTQTGANSIMPTGDGQVAGNTFEDLNDPATLQSLGCRLADEDEFRFEVSHQPQDANGGGQPQGTTNLVGTYGTGTDGEVILEDLDVNGRYEVLEVDDQGNPQDGILGFACYRNNQGLGNIANYGEYAIIDESRGAVDNNGHCIAFNLPEQQQVETGNLEITKYACAQDFLTALDDSEIAAIRPDENGVSDLTTIDGFDDNCEPLEGVRFGTITEEGVFESGARPWPGRIGLPGDGTNEPFNFGGTTDAQGQLVISGIEAGTYGRTLVTEIDDQNMQIVPENQTVAACNNVGRQVSPGSARNNYEVTLIPANGVSSCNYLNPAVEEERPPVIVIEEEEILVCKENEIGDPVENWNFTLERPGAVIETLNVNDAQGTDTDVSLMPGVYEVTVSGTYNYRTDDQSRADAGYSYRTESNLSDFSGYLQNTNWLDSYTYTLDGNTPRGLGLRINDTCDEDAGCFDSYPESGLTNWGNFAAENSYTIQFEHESSGPVKFSIRDNYYTDNLSGDMRIEISSEEANIVTDASGCAEVSVLPGVYTLTEEMQDGWSIITNPNGGTTLETTITVDEDPVDQQVYTYINNSPDVDDSIIPDDDGSPGSPQTNLQHSTFIEQVDPVETVQSGAQYVSTSVITNTGDTTLTDVNAITAPIEGASYVAGSWTGTETEPVFSSPGRWNIGTLAPAESRTISYVAQIDGSQEQGLYKDLVWAAGTDQNGEEIISEGVNSRYVNTSFVGDEIRIVADAADVERDRINLVEERTEEVTVTEEGEVLGASTGLPATGARTLWVIVATLLTVLGGGFFGAGAYLYRTQKKTPQLHPIAKPFRRGAISKKLATVVAALFITGFLFAGESFAAGLDIRLEDQQSPTGRNTFKLSFATLDIEGRNIQVKCYKNGPSDADPVQFGDTINVTAGGDSGFCQVDSSIVNQSGTYQFFVIAQAGDDEAVSETIAVDYNTDEGPGTPVSYNKSKSGCTYTITYKTANDDGETVRVELYRSQDTEFNIDAGTRVNSENIGSNQDGRFEDTPGDCGAEYYYAIRAFDNVGNASGVTGDAIINVTTTTTTVTTTNTTTTSADTTVAQTTTDTGGAGAVAVDNANIPAPEGGGVAEEDEGEGEGEGEEVQGVQEDDEESTEEDEEDANTEEDESDDQSTDEATEDQGDVLGEAEEAGGNSNTFVYVGIFGATVIFGVLAYFFLMRNKARF